MSKRMRVVRDEEDERYGDEGVVTRDRDLTEYEIEEIYDKAKRHIENDGVKEIVPVEEPPEPEIPHKKGLLKIKCACGRTSNVSDQVIEDGLSWSMLIGNDHYMTLACEECGANLTLFIDEIHPEYELPEESNKE